AFARSRGNIIAYLDSDNEWLPDYLQTVQSAFCESRDVQAVYCGVRRIDTDGSAVVHLPPFDAERLARQNFIDLNIYAHRRALWEAGGGFDPAVPRLSDWDLIRRHARQSPPRALPVVGAQYYEGDWPRITNSASAAYANHVIVSKDDVPI